MNNEPKIARTVVMRALRQPSDTDTLYAIRYVKADGSLGSKAKVSNQRKMPSGKAGHSLYKYSLKDNHVLLLYNHETNDFFAIKHRLITHFNGFVIDHRK